MDVLSNTLQVIRLTGAVFFTAQFAAPWAIASPPPEALADFLRLPSDCLALFHIVTEGSCMVALDGELLATLNAGDAVIFPHGSAHVMSSDTRARPTSIGELLPPLPFQGIPLITVGPRQNSDCFICGYLYCDQRFNPLIGALPHVLVVRASGQSDQEIKTAKAIPTRADVVTIQMDDWITATIRYMMQEALAMRQGSDAMLVRLTEILYVEVLRRYMQTALHADRGWLAGVHDPIIGQTLRLLHSQPERAWTVEELAYAVACSRSSLAQRFTAMIGESPIQYLAAWRMQLAQHLLKQTNMTIGHVAARVGYDSEAAFHRAFKRHFGEPPATWRMKQV